MQIVILNGNRSITVCTTRIVRTEGYRSVKEKIIAAEEDSLKRKDKVSQRITKRQWNSQGGGKDIVNSDGNRGTADIEAVRTLKKQGTTNDW